MGFWRLKQGCFRGQKVELGRVWQRAGFKVLNVGLAPRVLLGLMIGLLDLKDIAANNARYLTVDLTSIDAAFSVDFYY